jgi:hypothetical protein
MLFVENLLEATYRLNALAQRVKKATPPWSRFCKIAHESQDAKPDAAGGGGGVLPPGSAERRRYTAPKGNAAPCRSVQRRQGPHLLQTEGDERCSVHDAASRRRALRSTASTVLTMPRPE